MYHYGERMELRLLEETWFWSVQGREHAGVLKELLDVEEEFRHALSRFEERFGKLEGRAIQYVEGLARYGYKSYHLSAHTVRLVQKAYRVNQQFIEFLEYFLKKSQAAKSATARTLVNHIKNETEYFLGIISGLGLQRHKHHTKEA